MSDDELDLIRDALADAAEYRRHLAASCPNYCADTGTACDDCAAHHYAADGYDYLADALDQADVPIPGQLPLRAETDVPVRDQLL